MMRTKYTFFSVSLLLFSVLPGCIDEPPIDVPISTTLTEQSLGLVSELLSTFDVVTDLTEINNLFGKKEVTLLPSDLIIHYIDTSFDDGNGISLSLDFGELGEQPHGLLCLDNKYRAGKIFILLDKPYSEEGAELEVVIANEFPFYIGNGKKMTTLTGGFKLTRQNKSTLKMHCSSLQSISEDVKHDLAGDLWITTIKDAGIGLVNDELTFDGEITVKDSTSSLTMSISKPLVKNYTLDCAKHIVDGQLDIDLSVHSAAIKVEFDPHNDKSCDNEVAITIQGKRVIYTY
jgi:hypothetical protein